MTRAVLRSGLWRGHYVQAGQKFAQQMRLEFADGLIRGSGDDALGTFLIDGELRQADGELRLGWIKTYDGAHSVLYLGKWTGTRIEGRWHIGGWGEGFALEHVEQ